MDPPDDPEREFRPPKRCPFCRELLSKSFDCTICGTIPPRPNSKPHHRNAQAETYPQKRKEIRS
jgi:hypothetical protein